MGIDRSRRPAPARNQVWEYRGDMSEVPGRPGESRLFCIVDECDWFLDTGTHAAPGYVDSVVREHLAEHPIAEWVQMVVRLKRITGEFT